ncbi:hypothetical protein B0J11DRAFT_100418 [Dendryphion nanum]|uniref:Hydrophobin n=1 Tax=Dendryphion nanum TaxID=256645 RepID=A0A9P9DAE6_9PLEO|nr:hypothetical protein B0J11DRAFT_100418 [Dendryphion nanum]
MKFFAVLALAVGLVSAADICRSTGSGCSGNRICCAGIQENNCCNLGAAKSSLIWTLPANSRGQAFTGNSCSGDSAVFKNPNQVTNRCVNFNFNARFARWLVGGGTKRDVDENEVCTEINTAYYQLDGTEHKVQIPEGQAQVVADWIEKGEWQKLAALAKAE